MGDLLVRLLNAGAAARRATAFGSLALVGLVVTLLVYALLSSTFGLARDLLVKRELAGRLQAIAAMKPALLKQAEQAPSAQDGDGFLQGENEALVRSNLQAQIGTIATVQGATLISISNAPAIDQSGLRYLGVDVDLSGTVETVHDTISSIETTSPLVIRNASVWVSGGEQEGATQAPELTAQLQVYGALKPEAGRPAGKAAP